MTDAQFTTTTTTTTDTGSDYWARKFREESELIASAKGRILEVNRRSEGYDGDYYDVYDVVIWTGEAITSIRLGDTTGRHLVADATADVVDAGNDYLERVEFDRLVESDLAIAKTPTEGKLVVVARGRKVPVGFEGVIFWSREETYSPRYSNGWKKGPDAIKVGIAPVGAKIVNGKRDGAVFTYAKNCDVINADPYLTDTETLRERAKLVRRFKVAK